MKTLLLGFCASLGLFTGALAQDIESYRIGSETDTLANPKGGICLMGGATENDNAMRWFLSAANGGDVLVLRCTGTDAYNSYFYNDLGISLNSVETIVCLSAASASNAYLLDKIDKAEAIWFCGGDQWDYISYWRGTLFQDKIQEAIARKCAIGGTSAGMAILGDYYFTAENGTVSSETALANPYDSQVSIGSSSFLSLPYLEHCITDTHYDSPDRKGRHSVFLARIRKDLGLSAKGIACEEYTAVCIDSLGMAKVFGSYPTYDDAAYFIQVNCKNGSGMPEQCTAGQALSWNLGGDALSVYAVKGTDTGEYGLDLSNWSDGLGGSWEHWWVLDGVFSSEAGEASDCSTGFFDGNGEQKLLLYPNPLQGNLLQFSKPLEQAASYQIYSAEGKLVQSGFLQNGERQISVHNLASGPYSLNIVCAYETFRGSFVVEGR